MCIRYPNSLDFLERERYLKPHCSPFGIPESVTLDADVALPTPPDKRILLDGIWQMAISGDGPAADFSDAIPAEIPGSVHCALIAAGCLVDDEGHIIKDPYYAKYDKFARAASIRDYTFRHTFILSAEDATSRLRLSFGGVCEHCRVYLNGKELGEHRGMFGGPEYDISGIAREGENCLIVLLYGAPDRPRKPGEMPTFFGGGNPWLNLGWLDTATFNCTYGWHYADIPGLGIWRSVEIIRVPDAEMDSPFLTTLTTDGDMLLSCNIHAEIAGEATLCARIAPANFEGKAYTFHKKISLTEGNSNTTLSFSIPEPRLWNLNGKGKANLYTLSLTLTLNDTPVDGYFTRFGIRTLEMRPVAKPNRDDENGDPSLYNWTFVVNGDPTFMKGTGWCTPDALMRFTRERYDAFLSAAKHQNVNIVRAWGGGLVETDDFYDLCDEYGIAVFQEWPTAWDSYVCQPADVLEETVVYGVKRLRNRASLFLWCGGNEGAAPLESDNPAFDPTILNRLGTMTLELDGTRPWHRQEPFGGSRHDYIASWGRQHPSQSMVLESIFFGEFGVDCWPVYESVQKFTPREELDALEALPATGWEIPPDSVLSHHTPMFNKADDLSRQQQHVELFCPRTSVKNSILGSQLAQVVGVRHTLERARTRWPYSTGAIMYKLNDPYPAASWSTVDWYGSEKPASFFVGDAFAPLTAAVIFDKLNYLGEEVSLPVFLLNDGGENADAVEIKVYDKNLSVIKSLIFPVKGNTNKVIRLGELDLTTSETASAPLFVVTDVCRDSKSLTRNWYFLNFETVCGCLFNLPKTTVSCSFAKNTAEITNTGNLPAVCITFDAPLVSDRFRPADSCLWLLPGETVTVSCNFTDGVTGLTGWNLRF